MKGPIESFTLLISSLAISRDLRPCQVNSSDNADDVYLVMLLVDLCEHIFLRRAEQQKPQHIFAPSKS